MILIKVMSHYHKRNSFIHWRHPKFNVPCWNTKRIVKKRLKMTIGNKQSLVIMNVAAFVTAPNICFALVIIIPLLKLCIALTSWHTLAVTRTKTIIKVGVLSSFR